MYANNYLVWPITQPCCEPRVQVSIGMVFEFVRVVHLWDPLSSSIA